VTVSVTPVTPQANRERASENRYYMACLDLTGRRSLVVGAGPVALEKIEGLLYARARVTVVAPEAIDEVRNLAANGSIDWEQRPYRTEDLAGVFLTIAATSDTDLNTRIHADAEARSMLINVADVPHLCNFILPAVVREGPIAVAISTAGASPALAQRMKREARATLDPAYAELAEILEALRQWAKATLPTYQDRKAFFDAIVNGAPDPIDELRAGRKGQLLDRIARLQERHARRTAPA
jgi:precorrin-2 dehydrogenase / sirohydrochlorin ferrochelatase